MESRKPGDMYMVDGVPTIYAPNYQPYIRSEAEQAADLDELEQWVSDYVAQKTKSPSTYYLTDENSTVNSK